MLQGKHTLIFLLSSTNLRGKYEDEYGEFEL